MKKIISLALVFTFCLLALISCGKIEKDPMDLVKNLRKNDYVISMVVDEEDIEDEAENYEEYLDIKIDKDTVVCIIDADDDDEESGTFVYFSSKKAAKSLMNDLEKLMADDDYEDMFEDITVVRKGKVVYFGTEGVLKAAK